MQYAWAFVLLIPLAVAAWRRREWGVLALLAGLQAYGVRAAVFGIPTTLLELGIYSVAAISLVRGDWRGFSWAEPVKRYGWWLVLPALWLAAAVVSTLVSPDLRTAAGILKGWILDPMLLAALVVRYAERSAMPVRWWRQVIGALLLGAVVTTMHGFWQTWRMDLERLQSGGDSPNVLAMYLVPPLAMALAWFIQRSERQAIGKWKWGWSSAVLLVFWGVVKTGSYGAWLALAAALATGALWNWSKFSVNWRRLAAALAVIIGIGAPWLVVRSGVWPTPTHRNDTYGITSGQVRLVLWQEAVRRIGDSPWLGQGLGQWQREFTSYARAQGWLSIRNPGLAIELAHASLFPHQLWLTTWLMLGFLGVITLGGIVLLVMSAVGAAAAVPAAAFMAIMVHGMVDTPIFKNDLAALMWVAYAMAMWLGCQAKQRDYV